MRLRKKIPSQEIAFTFTSTFTITFMIRNSAPMGLSQNLALWVRFFIIVMITSAMDQALHYIIWYFTKPERD